MIVEPGPCIAVAVFSITAAFIASATARDDHTLVYFLVALSVSFGALAYHGFGDPAWQAKEAQEEKARVARERFEQTPHVIREADGCKVYAFKSGDRYHYFTRCKGTDKVPTESNWEECHQSGKTRTCTKKSETIQ